MKPLTHCDTVSIGTLPVRVHCSHHLSLGLTGAGGGHEDQGKTAGKVIPFCYVFKFSHLFGVGRS